MATSSFLALQNLKVPTPHLSVAFDQAVMTVGITTCYKCQMLMVVLRASCTFMHPPSGRPELCIPPWAVFQWVTVWFGGTGPSPGHPPGHYQSIYLLHEMFDQTTHPRSK